MRIRYRIQAIQDIAKINARIGERDVGAAARVATSIRQAIAYLVVFPMMGHMGIVRGTHEWNVKSLPYIIVYKIVESKGEIAIIAVFHGAQKR